MREGASCSLPPHIASALLRPPAWDPTALRSAVRAARGGSAGASAISALSVSPSQANAARAGSKPAAAAARKCPVSCRRRRRRRAGRRRSGVKNPVGQVLGPESQGDRSPMRPVARPRRSCVASMCGRVTRGRSGLRGVAERLRKTGTVSARRPAMLMRPFPAI